MEEVDDVELVVERIAALDLGGRSRGLRAGRSSSSLLLTEGRNYYSSTDVFRQVFPARLISR
jgi:hypothetical protein